MSNKYIPKEIADQILSLVKIEDIFSHYGYKVTGNGKAKGVDHCPKCGKDKNHIKINSETNLFQCFACGLSGNVFNLVMHIENVDYPESVYKVAEIIGFDIVIDHSKYEIKQDILKATVKFYKRYYKGQLQARGIDDETAKAYCIGFAPGFNNLYKHLKGLGFNDADMLEVGVIREIKGKMTDKFFNSVIIPDVRNGKIVDLYARIMDDNYDMHHLYLYGTNNLVGYHTIKESKTIGICEAPIDAVSFYKALGIPAVAIGGSKTKVKNIVRYIAQMIKEIGIETIILAFDNDESGIAATLEMIELLKGFDVVIKVLGFNSKDVNKALVENDDFRFEPAAYFSLKHFASDIPVEIIERVLRERKAL